MFDAKALDPMAAEFEFATRAFIPSAMALFAPLATAAAWPMAVEPAPPAVALAPRAVALSRAASALVPMAVELAPAAVTSEPMAIALSPDAVVM
ncbi:DNA-directed RNA polymerase II [Burkholderia cenocepacia]|uniref:DNA-directed RNA polymerase II n=1 Tax=Burkholderia cenocepacia TaxID=95486 RepID=UPI001F18F9A6|nr:MULTISPECIES: DNA-directed RNA polymerase II [Burkholderia]MCW5191573.1 DNA-directed RNA polymerase II [Burkholderia cenocepacia]